MGVVARVLGVSAVTSAGVAWLGMALLGAATGGSGSGLGYVLPALILACVGGMIGAVAGAAREVVAARGGKGAGWGDLD